MNTKVRFLTFPLSRLFFLFWAVFAAHFVYAQNAGLENLRVTPNGEYIFYHWGKNPWMDQMIKEREYTRSRHYFFNSRSGAYGPGLYMADKAYGSYTYVEGGSGGSGNGKGALVEVHILPTVDVKYVNSSSGWWLTTKRKGITFHNFTGYGLTSEEMWRELDYIPKSSAAHNILKSQIENLEVKRKMEAKFLSTTKSFKEDPEFVQSVFIALEEKDSLPDVNKTRVVLDLFSDHFGSIMQDTQYDWAKIQKIVADLGKLNKDMAKKMFQFAMQSIDQAKMIEVLKQSFKEKMLSAQSIKDFKGTLQFYNQQLIALDNLPFENGENVKELNQFKVFFREAANEALLDFFFDLPNANIAEFNSIVQEYKLAKQKNYPKALEKAMKMADTKEELKSLRLPFAIFGNKVIKGLLKKNKKRIKETTKKLLSEKENQGPQHVVACPAFNQGL